MTLFSGINSKITSRIADIFPIFSPPPSTLRTFTLYIGRPTRLLEQRIECDLAGLINPYWLGSYLTTYLCPFLDRIPRLYIDLTIDFNSESLSIVQFRHPFDGANSINRISAASFNVMPAGACDT